MSENYKKIGIGLGFFFFVHHYLVMRLLPLALKRFLRVLDKYLAKGEPPRNGRNGKNGKNGRNNKNENKHNTGNPVPEQTALDKEAAII